MTRPGWNPSTPLGWGDVERIATFPNGVPLTADGRYVFSTPIPANRSGRHILFSVWQRADSPEAFYGCSDVIVNAPAVETRLSVSQPRPGS